MIYRFHDDEARNSCLTIRIHSLDGERRDFDGNMAPPPSPQSAWSDSLQVTVTPSKPYYYVGELVEAVVVFRHAGTCSDSTNRPPQAPSLPARRRVVGPLDDQGQQTHTSDGSLTNLPPGGQAPRRIPKTHPHARQVSVSLVHPELNRRQDQDTRLKTIEETSTATAEAATSTRPCSPVSHRRRPTADHSRFSTDAMAYALDEDDLTILWAQVGFSATFTPTSQYIPPDPLLPLKSLMLHQPVGSGAFQTDSASADADGRRRQRNSRLSWALNFGTGTLGSGGEQGGTHGLAPPNPTLTGSLWNLAKNISSSVVGPSSSSSPSADIYHPSSEDIDDSGNGTTEKSFARAESSLEQERRRVWGSRDCPVLESPKTVLGVEMRIPRYGHVACESLFFLENCDIILHVADSTWCVSDKYTFPLPTTLPPSFRGKAYKFTYDLTLAFQPLFAHHQDGGDLRMASSESATDSRMSMSSERGESVRKTTGRRGAVQQVVVPIRVYPRPDCESSVGCLPNHILK